ncbi:MAG: hypothetical protein LBU25_04835 [Treponema sp.]|nr:hypothetical protein [Treponema sp.]
MNIILYSKTYRSITNRCILSFGALPKNELKENSLKNTTIPSRRDKRKQLVRSREPSKAL